MRGLIAASIAAMLAAGCIGSAGAESSPPAHTADPVALRVDGVPVPSSEITLLERDQRFQGKPADQSAAVAQAVDDALVRRAAADLHVTVDPAALRRAFAAAGGAQARDQLARFHIPVSHLRERIAMRLLTARVIAAKFGRIAAGTAALRRRYQHDRAKFHTPTLVRVSTIQVRSPAQGRTVLRLLHQGQSFARLANQFEVDPASRQSGPDQGWKAPSLLPQPAQRQLLSTPKGHVVPTLVRIQTSYLVVKVTDRRAARTASFREVRGAVAKVVDTALRRQAFDRWLMSQRKRAEVQYITVPKPTTS